MMSILMHVMLLSAFVICAIEGSGNYLVSKGQFVRAVTNNGYPTPTHEQYLNFVSRAANGKISTKRELAMFLANILHESDGLRAKEEYNPGTYPHPALDRPGKSYHGRGYIQLTWSYNYKDASEALYGDLRLLNHPEQVATNDAIAWDTAFWYWGKYVHNASGISDGWFGVSIRKINSPECNGSDQRPRRRYAMYQKIFRAFEVSGQPIERGCYN
jgi:chitinase